ncbi:MAG TPA: GntG family PLP-dependent aldolase [Acidimicrobiales bacterium]|nr:GntG family PLP-dependent aldolase [Acidimicrobiales bacterium]
MPPTPEHPVDLRSDTVTQPTPGMRAAMAAAEVGDDHYGEDPSVNALESEVAALFGHEAAIFVPTGTMGNNISLRLLAEPASEVIAGEDAHVVTYEMAGLAALGGVQTRTVRSDGGLLDPATVAEQLRVDPPGRNSSGDNYAMVETRAVAIENTHVHSGGRAWRLEDVDALVGVTDPLGVALHCDGARIWNAAVATGTKLEEYGSRFATLSVCLSKGLGCPVGSLVVTSSRLEGRARAMRRQLGGAMRQVGVLAAAGSYALSHHLERLEEDHRRARQLAASLAEAVPGCVVNWPVETNMVLLDVPEANVFAAELAKRGVLTGSLTPTVLRLVTHLDLDDGAIAYASEVIRHELGTTTS